MVASTFGFIAAYQTDKSSNLNYNGFPFLKKDNLWVTKATPPFGTEKKEYSFLLHPLEITTKINPDIPSIIKQAPTITLTFDPNITSLQYVDAARFELTQFLGFDLGKDVQNAVLAPSLVYNLSVVSCPSKSDTLYITFITSNETSAFAEGNCITIATNNPLNYVAYAEEIIYDLLGIMKK